MKTAPLTIDVKQLNAFYKMLDASCVYYNNTCKQPNNMIDLCTDALRADAMAKLYTRVHQLQLSMHNSQVKLYVAKIEFNALEALTILGSIIPPGNSSYNDDVKQIVIDYCISVLKQNNILPNHPTYTPANVSPNIVAPYLNKSTSFEDYIDGQ